MKIDISAKARIRTTLDASKQIEALARNTELWDSDRETITQKLSEILAEDGTVDDAISDVEFDLDWRSAELTDEQWDHWQHLVNVAQAPRNDHTESPDPRVDTCPHCDQPVIWAVDVDDTSIPLDPEPAVDGTIEIIGHVMRFSRHRPLVRTVQGPDMFGTDHYHPHTCTTEVAA